MRLGNQFFKIIVLELFYLLLNELDSKGCNAEIGFISSYQWLSKMLN